MLSFWMFLIPWSIWDGEVNYSTLKGPGKEKLVLKISILVLGKIVYSNEREDIQKESRDLSGIERLCREQPFALEHICWGKGVCLERVIWELSTFYCSPCQDPALRMLCHVCGKSTVDSCAHRYFHSMHLQHSLCVVCVQRKGQILLYGWQFGLGLKEEKMICRWFTERERERWFSKRKLW